MNSLRFIIVQHSDTAGQWSAYFADALHIAFGSDVPMGTVRRLLHGTVSLPGEYELYSDQVQVGSGVLVRAVTWPPPELLFPCPACEGKGQYVGLIEVETCRVCGGRCANSAVELQRRRLKPELQPGAIAPGPGGRPGKRTTTITGHTVHWAT